LASYALSTASPSSSEEEQGVGNENLRQDRQPHGSAGRPSIRHQRKNVNMGSEYRAEKDILANELFDGRLQKFGVCEHGQAREDYRCLTDGENCLGVPINDAGYVTGFERAWNGIWGSPEKILSAVSDAFETKIFSYQEPEYYGFESEEQKAAWRSKQTEIEEWLAIRKAEALKIDPDTAEVDWEYGQTLDPYGVYPELPEEYQQVGREYFARASGSEVWVNFGDLPQETRDRLWIRHSRKLAFPAGLEGFPETGPESVGDEDCPF
jgi:hypothetical protein